MNYKEKIKVDLTFFRGVSKKKKRRVRKIVVFSSEKYFWAWLELDFARLQREIQVPLVSEAYSKV